MNNDFAFDVRCNFISTLSKHMHLFGSNLQICFQRICNLSKCKCRARARKFRKMESWICVDQNAFQTLAVMCRSIWVSVIFRTVAARENISGFYLI